MKQNDWLVASINNPDFTPLDFKDVSGLTLDNTLFKSKDYYKQSDFIRNLKMFQDNLGKFSDTKFDSYYNLVASTFRDFSSENLIDNYEYSIWDTSRPANGRIKNINFNLNTVNNPDHVRIGVEGINVVTDSDKSRRELAQNSKIFDSSTGKFLDKSVNDISLFSNPFEYIKSLFSDPLVYATYDRDTEEIDPITGNKVKHYKGEWKVNSDGEYYVETANGKNLNGKTVVSSLDYLTPENSALNSVDFFDSDDKEKSTAGVIAKNIAAIAPMFIPYVNTAYSGLMVGRELMKSLPMAYGMVTSLLGDQNPNSKLMNTLAAYGLKFTGSTSDYALENTFAFENFGNLLSDVALLWGQLKFIANTFNKLSKGGEAALNTAQAKAAKQYVDSAEKYILESLSGKISNAQLTSYLGTDKPFEILKLIESGKWTETSLGKAALNKFLPEAEKIAEARNNIAKDLSLGYMAIISNTDVYDAIIQKGGTPGEAAAIALGSTIGMFSVDKYLGLGEMFFLQDVARTTLRKTARETAELFMQNLAKDAIDVTTKKGIIGTIQKGINLGKDALNKFGENYRNKTLGIIGKSLGEGAEEVSEELVTDFTKYLGELAGRLGYFSKTDYGAFENAGDRYLMSFLGGAAGGLTFGGVEAWNNRNVLNKETLKDLVSLLQEGKKDKIFSELTRLKKKGQLGDTNLSYEISEDSEGNKTYLTADSDHKSLAETNFENLSNIINLLDLILNGNDLKLSKDDVFDRMVQGEYRAAALSDFLKGKNKEEVKQASFISQYLKDFDNISNAIVNKENEINNLIENTTDENKRKSTEYADKLEKLKAEKKELVEEKENLFGKNSLGYVEKTLFAMDTALSGQFLSLNLNLYARELTGKSLESLSKSELKTVEDRYKKWKGNAPLDVDKAYKLYKDMEKNLVPELNNLANANFESDFKAIEGIRDRDISKDMLSIEDKLDSETLEEYDLLSNLLEGESDEDYQKRLDKHKEGIIKHNFETKLKNIQEIANHPITSSDFRYFVTLINTLRGELLHNTLDYSTNGKHWWELKFDGEADPSETKLLEKLNKELHDLILNRGVEDVDALKDTIKKRIADTAKKLINIRYKEVTNNRSIFNTLSRISNLSEDEKVAKGMPDDYILEDDNLLTYEDLYTYTAYLTHSGESLEQVLFDLEDYIDPDVFGEFYAEARLDSNRFESPKMKEVATITEDKYKEKVKELTQDIENTYFTNLDKFVDTFNKLPQIKALNSLEKASFVNNPVIPLLNKISLFSANSNVKVEDFLQDIYNIYNSNKTHADFQLSDYLVQVLQNILKDFNIAKAYIYGASTNINDTSPVGHNKAINNFIENHKDVFGDTSKLPEIKKEYTDILFREILNYEKEINSWLQKHEINSGLRDLKFIKANEKLNTSIQLFFTLNRDAFKISPTVDLLDGYEEVTLDNSLSSIVKLLELLYKNRLKSKLSVKEILDKLNNNLFDTSKIILQESTTLDENLSYDKLTDYDKFQLLVSSMAVSSVSFYKKLKAFIDANDKLAPITLQEYVSKLVFAQNNNPKFINDALNWLKTTSGSSMGITFNTSVVTGVGGSGKTFAVSKLNLGDGKNVWLSGPSESLVTTLKQSMPNGKEMEKSKLFETIFGGTSYDISKLYTVSTKNKAKIVNLKNDLGIKTITNPPKALVIDEATHLSTPELLIVSKFCNLNNINLVLLGDYHLNGYWKEGIGSCEDNSLIAWRSPSMYLSLRNGTVLKYINQNPLVLMLDKLSVEDTSTLGDSVYNSLFKDLTLKYYTNDTDFVGELITENIPDDIIKKIPKTATVGFIGSPDSPSYKKLVDAGLLVSDPISPLQVQGKEFDYVVVDKNWELEIVGDNWGLNNNRLITFAKDLYTMITRSTKGTILIDNNLSSIIHNSKSTSGGIYSGISESVKKFRDVRIPEIEQALKDNKETPTPKPSTTSPSPTPAPKPDTTTSTSSESTSSESTTPPTTPESTAPTPPSSTPPSTTPPSTSESTSSTPLTSSESTTTTTVGGEEITEESLKDETTAVKLGDNSEEEADSDKEEINQNIISDFPIVAYTNVSYSGINTASKEWVNDTNSTTDLGIFVKPGETYSGNKVTLMKKLLGIKSAIIYGSEYYDRLPIKTKQLFSKEAFDNMQYFIKIENATDSNRLIGLTEESGLSNDNRTILGKIIKIVGKLEGNDGKTYTISLGGLNNPETWRAHTSDLKAYIKKRIESGEGDTKELLKLYDSYDDIITKYSTTVDEWVKEEREFRINPPKISQHTRLINLGSSYRLENSTSKYSPYHAKAPLLVESEVYITTDDIPGMSPKMKGKPVMFLSSNILLTPGELKDEYIKQLNDSTRPRQVRMVLLNNVGVSFKSLYLKKWEELYNKKVGKITFTTPMELQPFAIRMYKSMWNYRSGLSRFIERYDSFCKENGLNDNDITKLCQEDNAEYLRIRGDADYLDEATYRKSVPKEKAETLKVLWDFNDSLANYVKEFRLGYNSTHGAYLRKLTNIDSKFYDDPKNVVGIYINPEIAKMQLGVINNIFTNIIDKIIPPVETNTKTYITTDFGKIEGWFKNVYLTNDINLEFTDENASTKSTIHLNDKSTLTALPLTLIKAAHYMSIQMNMGVNNFTEYQRLKAEDGVSTYTISYLDNPINWTDIINPILNQTETDPEATYTNNIPGVIPYDKKSNTGVYDARLDDLFNLMFHGVISTPVENDFTADNIRATFASFKYGIFSDPILIEKKSESTGIVSNTVTNNKFFSLDAAASYPTMAVDITPYKEDTSTTITPKPTESVTSPIEEMYNKIQNPLNKMGIEINTENYDNVGDCIQVIESKITDRLVEVLQNNDYILFEDIIDLMDVMGNITFLKDRPEFKDKTFKEMESLPNSKKITMLDTEGKEHYYNVYYDKKVQIKEMEPERVHPESVSTVNAKETLLLLSSEFFNSNNLNDDVEIYEDFLNETFPDGEIAWDTFEKLANKVIGYFKENYEEDGKDISSIRDKINQMLNSCSL